ncbi:hypothetical protein [Bradyrhizobium pachyrhizi]|uniref:hypothetical protein n=1 Tax=Bradyrhizobium pachyrhizi TaxID=280333 RepID=UPI003D35FE25
MTKKAKADQRRRKVKKEPAEEVVESTELAAIPPVLRSTATYYMRHLPPLSMFDRHTHKEARADFLRGIIWA